MTVQDWHPGHSIRYKADQVIWLISILNLLRIGEYPPDPKETGYVGGGKTRLNAKAKFTMAVEIATEIDIRLERAGIDGLLLEMCYTHGEENRIFMEQHAAKAMDMDINEVDKRIHRALKYVSGARLKQRTYKDFQDHKGSKK